MLIFEVQSALFGSASAAGISPLNRLGYALRGKERLCLYAFVCVCEKEREEWEQEEEEKTSCAG